MRTTKPMITSLPGAPSMQSIIISRSPIRTDTGPAIGHFPGRPESEASLYEVLGDN